MRRPNPPVAYLPVENHVADLAPGQSTNFSFSLGFGSCLSRSPWLRVAPAFSSPFAYDVVATQPGISPSDAHNGGAYTVSRAPRLLNLLIH